MADGDDQRRFDSWMSAVTGLGGPKDKRNSYWHQPDAVLTIQQTNDLFRFSDIAARICSMPPDESLADCWEVKVDDPELKNALAERLKELAAVAAFKDAATFGRVAGDCALFVDVADGRPLAAALDPSRVTKINFLRKVERDLLQPYAYYSDPRAPNFGLPSVYEIGPSGGPGLVGHSFDRVLVHESRFLWFTGARTSDYARRQQLWWHDSVLQRVQNVLRDFGVAWDNAALLLGNSVQGVYSVQDLVKILNAPDGAKLLSQRIDLLDYARGATKSLVIDAESEKFEYIIAPLTSLPDILDRFGQRLAAAADGMPVTKLLGISPAGMNATGENDRKNWFALLSAFRTDHLTQPAVKLTELLLNELGNADADYQVTWPPLDKPSEAEAATIRNTMATSDATYISSQVLTPEQVVKARFGGPDGYSIETHIDMAEWQAARDEQDAKDAELALAEAEIAAKSAKPVPGKPVGPAA